MIPEAPRRWPIHCRAGRGIPSLDIGGALKICDLALFAPDTSSGVKTYITSKIEYVRVREHIEHIEHANY